MKVRKQELKINFQIASRKTDLLCTEMKISFLYLKSAEKYKASFRK